MIEGTPALEGERMKCRTASTSPRYVDKIVEKIVEREVHFEAAHTQLV